MPDLIPEEEKYFVTSASDTHDNTCLQVGYFIDLIIP